MQHAVWDNQDKFKATTPERASCLRQSQREQRYSTILEDSAGPIKHSGVVQSRDASTPTAHVMTAIAPMTNEAVSLAVRQRDLERAAHR